MSWTSQERVGTSAIGGIFACRVFGLMAVMPVMMLALPQYTGATPAMMGVAIGIYGLTQALFQLPMGILSDRLGRRHVVISGLVIMALGSWIASQSHTMTGLILGRAIQGMGAVGSTLSAWLADLTEEKHRSMAMAFMGMAIGGSFVLATGLGPILYQHLHLNGLFGLTACLACLAIAITLKLPQPTQQRRVQDTQQRNTRLLLQNKSLQFINTSVAILHALYTLTLAVLPSRLQTLATHHSTHWLYLPSLILATVASLLLLRLFSREKHGLTLLQAGIACMGIALLIPAFAPIQGASMGGAMTLFFLGFTLLEALLPALASQMAPQELRGATMGMFSTAQYMGLFLGGVLSGWLLQHSSVTLIFAGSASCCLLWWYLLLKTYHQSLASSPQ